LQTNGLTVPTEEKVNRQAPILDPWVKEQLEKAIRNGVIEANEE
jgi:hypothetical protein